MDARLGAWALFGLLACRSAPAILPEARADERLDSGATTGIAVVELFTSEGCSSCPPADRELADFAASSDTRIYALSFHVDYWDQLGWPDRFASADFTRRQQAYAGALGTRGMYTPQMVVNGSEELVGSDGDRAEAAVSRALAKPANVRLAIHARWTAPDAAAVDYDLSAVPRTASIVLAVVERHATTSVLRGENAGKTLRHENVVRSLASSPLTGPTGTVVVQVPASLGRDNAQVIGWVQLAPSSQGMPVVGAARSPLPER